MSATPILTIVLPVFNEVETISQAINDVASLDVDKEIIIIDNYSTDGTRDILRSINNPEINILYNDRNRGFGFSFKRGLELARGDYLFIHFARCEYEYTKCLEMLLLCMNNNLDAVFGSRLVSVKNIMQKFKAITERPPFLASFILTYLVNKWYSRSFTDIIGIKLYRVKNLKNIPINTYGFGFEAEHISRMCKAGFSIGEVRVGYWPTQDQRRKKIKPYHLVNLLWVLFREKYLVRH